MDMSDGANAPFAQLLIESTWACYVRFYQRDIVQLIDIRSEKATWNAKGLHHGNVACCLPNLYALIHFIDEICTIPPLQTLRTH